MPLKKSINKFLNETQIQKKENIIKVNNNSTNQSPFTDRSKKNASIDQNINNTLKLSMNLSILFLYEL